VLLTGGASSVPHDSQKLSATPIGSPQVGQVTPFISGVLPSCIKPSSRASAVMSASGAGLR